MTGNDSDGTGRRTARFYSAARMEAFLTEWRDRYGFRSIYDDSDTFNLGDKHTLAMCEAYKNVGLPWSAMTRADTIKPETWQAMKDAGCFGVKIGFESGSQEVIDKIIHKNLDLKKARRTVFFLKSIGMTVHGTFSYGAPGETREQMQETRRYRDSLPLDSYQESGVASIEGTPLDSLEKGQKIKGYPLAMVDGGYIHESDGSKKMAQINSTL